MKMAKKGTIKKRVKPVKKMSKKMSKKSMFSPRTKCKGM